MNEAKFLYETPNLPYLMFASYGKWLTLEVKQGQGGKLYCQLIYKSHKKHFAFYGLDINQAKDAIASEFGASSWDKFVDFLDLNV